MILANKMVKQIKTQSTFYNNKFSMTEESTMKRVTNKDLQDFIKLLKVGL